MLHRLVDVWSIEFCEGRIVDKDADTRPIRTRAVLALVVLSPHSFSLVQVQVMIISARA